MQAVGNKNWWALALNGIIAILFGVLAIFVPSSTILVLGKYFGFVVLLGGLILLFVAIRHAKAKDLTSLLSWRRWSVSSWAS